MSKEYLKRQREFRQQLTNKDGSRASLLIQARADMLVTGWPSLTVILKHNKYNELKHSLQQFLNLVNLQWQP